VVGLDVLFLRPGIVGFGEGNWVESFCLVSLSTSSDRQTRMRRPEIPFFGEVISRLQFEVTVQQLPECSTLAHLACFFFDCR
jgi:NAD-dependent SIR2 family protein deacetylase